MNYRPGTLRDLYVDRLLGRAIPFHHQTRLFEAGGHDLADSAGGEADAWSDWGTGRISINNQKFNAVAPTLNAGGRLVASLAGTAISALTPGAKGISAAGNIAGMFSGKGIV